MGEAKRRGSQAEREASAIAARRALFPASVKCNNCQADLTEITPMDVRGMPGMRLAGGAHCFACQHDTWVLDGTQAGLSLFRQFLDEEHGAGAVSSGLAAR
jgi:hypothetical protein